jgi:hypothetical protein
MAVAQLARAFSVRENVSLRSLQDSPIANMTNIQGYKNTTAVQHYTMSQHMNTPLTRHFHNGFCSMCYAYSETRAPLRWISLIRCYFVSAQTKWANRRQQTEASHLTASSFQKPFCISSNEVNQSPAADWGKPFDRTSCLERVGRDAVVNK